MPLQRRGVLGHHAGAAQVHVGIGNQVVQVQQLGTEGQVVDIADETVPGQVGDGFDRCVCVQVGLGRVQPQSVVAQPTADVRAVLRAFEGDDQVGLALGQADEVRQRQDVHRDGRVPLDEVAQLRGDEETAEAFGAAHADVPGQRHAGA